MNDNDNQSKESKRPWLKWVVIGGAVVLIVLVVALRSSDSDESSKESQPESSATVRVAIAEKQDVQSWVFAEGTARSASREYLTFQSAGRVAFVDPELREGSLVEKDALLAYQDQRRIQADLTDAETALEVARSELEQAKTQANLAQKTFERYSALVERDSASQQELDESNAQAENAKADVARAESRILSAEAKFKQVEVAQEDTEIRSPMAGMLAYLNIEQGFYFMPSNVRSDSEESALNTVPIVLIDPTNFEIDVTIPDYEQNRVRPGQSVFIKPGSSAGAMPSQNVDSANYINGEVFSVSPAVSPSGRSIQVEIHTNADASVLKDGMFVTAWIAVEVARDAVAIPLDTILYRNNKPYTFVVDPSTQRAQRRDLQLGIAGADTLAVQSGVEAGELLVTDGRYQLSEGSKVKVLDEPTTKTSESVSQKSSNE